MPSILVTLTSRSGSYFERSNISFYENKLDGVELNSNGLDDRIRKNGQRIPWFSADCKMLVTYSTRKIQVFSTGFLLRSQAIISDQNGHL